VTRLCADAAPPGGIASWRDRKPGGADVPRQSVHASPPNITPIAQDRLSDALRRLQHIHQVHPADGCAPRLRAIVPVEDDALLAYARAPSRWPRVTRNGFFFDRRLKQQSPVAESNGGAAVAFSAPQGSHHMRVMS